MRNPYQSVPDAGFWSKGVKGQNWAEIEGLYQPKFEIPSDARIMTAGSCFAQHIGNRLRASGFNVLDRELPPAGLSLERAKEFGYRLYTARYGNIYTARQLLQLMMESFGQLTPGEVVWPKKDRFVDALRPNVEPEGLETAEEVLEHRKRHLYRVRLALQATDLFIFTFGLTETWMHRETGTVFPVVPGTSAGGVFNPDRYEFKNFSFSETYVDFLAFRKRMKKINPAMRFLITVSPVPLVATAANRHVLTSTTYSKSVLRAVAGQLSDALPDVDYFPSYELITAPFSRQFFYEDDLRSVRPDAVEMVMQTFFRAHGVTAKIPKRKLAPSEVATLPGQKSKKDDVVCEEMLLQAFAK